MDQRSDYIRQDIESTRASLDDKLDTLESKARQTLDLKHQVAERPWMALGAAVAAGYILGSLGGSDSDEQPRTRVEHHQATFTPEQSYKGLSDAPRAGKSGSESFLSQFDDEIALLKTAAISTLTSFLHDTIKEYVPALGQQLEQNGRRTTTPSTAQGASRYYTERSEPITNTEAIPTTTSYGSNMVDRTASHATPYYPPGSPGTRSEGEHQRKVGEEVTR